MERVKLPCPACPSSDAFGYDDKGWGHCFSCGINIPPGGEECVVAQGSADIVRDAEIVPLPKRGLRQETAQKYGYGVAPVHGKAAQLAPYFNDRGQMVAQKVRFPDK